MVDVAWSGCEGMHPLDIEFLGNIEDEVGQQVAVTGGLGLSGEDDPVSVAAALRGIEFTFGKLGVLYQAVFDIHAAQLKELLRRDESHLFGFQLLDQVLGRDDRYAAHAGPCRYEVGVSEHRFLI
jgi:hypothetical protein